MTDLSFRVFISKRGMILVFEGGCQDEIRMQTSAPRGCFPDTKGSSAVRDESRPGLSWGVAHISSVDALVRCAVLSDMKCHLIL